MMKTTVGVASAIRRILVVASSFWRAGVDARDDGHDPQPRPHAGDTRNVRRRTSGATSRRSLPATVAPTSPTILDAAPARRSRRSSTGGTGVRGRAPIARRRGSQDDLAAGGSRPGDGLRRPGPIQAWCCSRANPATGEARAVRRRDVRRQGEDVVAGRMQPEPISVLDERMPAVAARAHADRLERQLRRHVRHRVHDRGRPPVAAPGARSASAARRPPCGSRSTWRRTGRFPLSRADAMETCSCRCSRTRRCAQRPERQPPSPARTPGCPPRRGPPAARSRRRPKAPSRRPKQARRVMPRAVDVADDVHGMARRPGS